MEYQPVDFPWQPGFNGPFIPRGWAGPNRRPRGQKPRWAFVWPKDGKRGTTFGRLKDVLEDKGPDIYIASWGHGGWDKPRRSRWSRWPELDPFDPHVNGGMTFGWAQHKDGQRYDFRKRRYTRPNAWTWTDARWPLEPNDHFEQPGAYRCIDGQWFQIFRSPWGGVPLRGWNYRR